MTLAFTYTRSSSHGGNQRGPAPAATNSRMTAR
jgi:hypothetical protein